MLKVIFYLYLYLYLLEENDCPIVLMLKDSCINLGLWNGKEA